MGIQQDPIILRIPPALKNIPPSDSCDTAAWIVIHKFATSDMSFPKAEEALHAIFGDTYIDEKWWLVLDAVMAAKNDVSIAIEAVKRIQLITNTEHIPIPD